MLMGPPFMLQVYDRVPTSRSEATLVALIDIVAFLFLTMVLLDHARSRVLARAGAARPVGAGGDSDPCRAVAAGALGAIAIAFAIGHPASRIDALLPSVFTPASP